MHPRSGCLWWLEIKTLAPSGNLPAEHQLANVKNLAFPRERGVGNPRVLGGRSLLGENNNPWRYPSPLETSS